MTRPTLSDRPSHGPVRAGEEQDWAALEAYLRRELPDAEGPFSVQQFPKGYANLTYLVTLGASPLVVRRPPFGRIAPGAHDMGREFRALAALSPLFPPAPRPLAFCEDESVIGAPFIVVEYREGVGVWDSIPSAMAHHPDVGDRVGRAAVRALADLHQIDASSGPIADLGRPEGFVERQVAGWLKRWTLVESDGVPEMQRVADLLGGSVPSSPRHAVLHNDFKLDNCQFDPDDPDRVKSIFDWDQATLGDPLIDLGILLNYWPDPADDPADPAPYVAGLRSVGLPPRADVIEEYAALTGIDVGRIGWYEAFAAWKTAVVQQQLLARYQRGESTDSRMASLEPSIRTLGRRALELLGKDR